MRKTVAAAMVVAATFVAPIETYAFSGYSVVTEGTPPPAYEHAGSDLDEYLGNVIITVMIGATFMLMIGATITVLATLT